MERLYLPELAELTDRLSITNLKSIKLGIDPEKKENYEKEAKLIMNDINLIMTGSQHIVTDWGKLFRGIQLDTLANELIWANETLARQGGSSQNHLLPLTHSINSVRMLAGNMVANQMGERKDLNSDRLNHEVCLERGLNFSGCFA